MSIVDLIMHLHIAYQIRIFCVCQALREILGNVEIRNCLHCLKVCHALGEMWASVLEVLVYFFAIVAAACLLFAIALGVGISLETRTNKER